MTLRRKLRSRKPGRPKGSKAKTKRNAKGQGRRKRKPRNRMLDLQHEIVQLQRERAALIGDYKSRIKILEDMVQQARLDAGILQAEERHMKASHEYAYGSIERLGKIRELQAEIWGLKKQAMAPTAAWSDFMVSGMPDSIEEVWRLIEVDRQTREQSGDR